MLRSGGRVAIYVTNRTTMERWPFAGPETHRVFDAVDLQATLEQAGFKAESVTVDHIELP